MERSSAQELAVVAYGEPTKPQLNVEIAELTKRLSQLEKLVRKSLPRAVNLSCLKESHRVLNSCKVSFLLVGRLRRW